VAEEAQRPQRPLPPDVEGHKADQTPVVVAHGHDAERARPAEVAPPGRDPVPGREDVVGTLGQRIPPVAQGLELVDDVDAQRARRRVAGDRARDPP
jgi:hypothetical protein